MAKSLSPPEPRYTRQVEEPENKLDTRSATQLDRDRLLYGSNLARLAEVTQTISADHGYVFHNRLTHTLKVAQLARRIAERLSPESSLYDVPAIGGLDVDAAETAALAHDLGHPPFGHIAEDELNKAMTELADSQNIKVCSEGYEGNAQSFRLVTQIMVGDANCLTAGEEQPSPLLGLNLTKVSLNAILKYPWFYKQNPQKGKKWGAYKSEESFFNFARSEFELGGFVKSLEAEIMDWADDITYAVHDVVDFYQAGQIPLERFTAADDTEKKTFFKDVFMRNTKYDTNSTTIGYLFDERFVNETEYSGLKSDYEKGFETVCTRFFYIYIVDRYKGTEKQRQSIWQMMTGLITEYVQAISISKDPVRDGRTVRIDRNKQIQIEMLKQLTWHYVILQSDLATAQHGQRRIIRDIFNELSSEFIDKKQPNMKLFPAFSEEQLKKVTDRELKVRVVADFISSMTEKEIVSYYQKLFSHKVGPGL